MNLSSHRRGPVAQLGARFHGMEEVVGSIPTRSTRILKPPDANAASNTSGLCAFSDYA